MTDFPQSTVTVESTIENMASRYDSSKGRVTVRGSCRKGQAEKIWIYPGKKARDTATTAGERVRLQSVGPEETAIHVETTEPVRLRIFYGYKEDAVPQTGLYLTSPLTGASAVHDLRIPIRRESLRYDIVSLSPSGKIGHYAAGN